MLLASQFTRSSARLYSALPAPCVTITPRQTGPAPICGVPQTVFWKARVLMRRAGLPGEHSVRTGAVHRHGPAVACGGEVRRLLAQRTQARWGHCAGCRLQARPAADWPSRWQSHHRIGPPPQREFSRPERPDLGRRRQPLFHRPGAKAACTPRQAEFTAGTTSDWSLCSTGYPAPTVWRSTQHKPS